MNRKVIIIGSGPAGLTAAIYAGRANLNPLVFEGNQPGGQLTITTDVENYPGFPDGVQGPEMMELFRKQAQRFGAETKMKHVSRVDFSERPFKVWVNDDLFFGDSIIISTGASARTLGLDSEKELMGYGVSTCATCDGYFFKDKKLLVVGGGDSAMEESIFLTKYASEVWIVHRRDQFRASKIMQNRIEKNPKIQVHWNSVVEDIQGTKETGVTSVVLKDTTTSELREESCDGVFLAIGHTPNTSLFTDSLEMNENGYILTKNGSSATNISGVFACGDVVDDIYRQAITAAGSGCMAALEAVSYLDKVKNGS